MSNRLYIANLGMYNEGSINGEWFEFPVDMKQVTEVLSLKGDYEEYIILDSETIYPIEIHEYSNINSLNEKIAELEEIEGLSYLLELINNDPYGVNNWGAEAISVLNELDIEHDIVDDEWIDEQVKHIEGWTSVRVFLYNADATNDYHTIDGYGNVDVLKADEVKWLLNDYIKNLFN